MDIIVYSNVALTFALGAFLASVIARLAQTDAHIDAVAKEIPSQESVEEEVGRVITRAVPEALVAALDHPRFKKQLAAMVEAAIVKGPFAGYVKETIGEQCRNMNRYIEDEVIPRALAARERQVTENVAAA